MLSEPDSQVKKNKGWMRSWLVSKEDKAQAERKLKNVMAELDALW